MFVLRESLLECSFCQSDGVLHGIVCCDSGDVDAGYFLVVLVYYMDCMLSIQLLLSLALFLSKRL